MDSTPHSSPVKDVLRYDIKTRCYRKLEKLGQTRKNFLSVMFFFTFMSQQNWLLKSSLLDFRERHKQREEIEEEYRWYWLARQADL